MSLLFPPWTNTLARVSLFSLLLGVIVFFSALMLYVRSPLFRRSWTPEEQPVQFDHRHHVADDGIDCRYCHSTVEESPRAGYPPTALCMNCHAQVWNRSGFLAPVRKSYFADRAILWRRIHKLPDYVYFNHSIHVAKGVGCVVCHGRVDRMAAIEQIEPLTMGWCVECHRDPAPRLRPRDRVTSMDWQPPSGSNERAALAAELVAQYQVHARVTCETCHR